MRKEPTISRSELDLRLKRIKDYNAYQMEAGQPHHCTKHHELEDALKQWGYPIELATKCLGPHPTSRHTTEQPEPTKALAVANVAPEPTEGIENVL